MSGPIHLEDQIACVRREIRRRERVSPRWVAAEKMTQAKADAELAAMRAVLATLEGADETLQGVTGAEAPASSTRRTCR